MIRRALDLLYAASGAMAVCSLGLIALLTLSQVVARLAGTLVPSADDFAGFAMAGAVFLGFAYTLRAGGHVRVLTLLARLSPRARQAMEGMCAGTAAAIVACLVWYTADMIVATRQIGEFTIGLIPVPKWIPMLLMFTGLSVLLVALVDELVRILRGEPPVYAQQEEKLESSVSHAE